MKLKAWKTPWRFQGVYARLDLMWNTTNHQGVFKAFFHRRSKTPKLHHGVLKVIWKTPSRRFCTRCFQGVLKNHLENTKAFWRWFENHLEITKVFWRWFENHLENALVISRWFPSFPMELVRMKVIILQRIIKSCIWNRAVPF